MPVPAAVRPVIDNLRRRWKPFDHFCYYWHTRRLDFTQKPPLLIYQMSKVGSAAVYRSLEAADLNYHIFHVHYLTEDRFRHLKKWHRERREHIPVHVPVSRALKKQVGRHRRDVPWTLITLVRDPVKRDLSGYFQISNLYQKEFFNERGGWDSAKTRAFIEKRLCEFDEKTDFACNWFDEQIKAVFGIDVFAYPFPKEQGYQIIREENINLLIFRLEDLTRCFSPAVKEFLGLEKEPPLVRTNVGKDKSYSDVYKEVGKNIRLPREICEKIYSSRLVRHFYTPEERDAMIRQWAR